jgi:hypothetical protein
MIWLRRFSFELWSLFVDDGSFALAILLWVGITVFILPRVLADNWKGPALFGGLAAILVENVCRSAKRRRRK